MRDGRPIVLIAAPVAVIRELGGIFAKDEMEVAGAETWEQAVAELRDEQPDLVIVCYAFDEVRPFRLLQYMRRDWRHAPVPTILVRSLPVSLGKSQEAEIGESYRTLGVDEFVNLHDQKLRLGRKTAYEQFREAVLRRLPRAPGKFSDAKPKHA